MKKYHLNEKGMALVYVLLVMFLFSIIGIVLFNITVSSSKQVDKIEQDMQAVDLAEMGVIFYKNQIILQADQVLTQAIEEAIKEIEAENSRKSKNDPPIAINSTTVLARIKVIYNSFLPNIALNTPFPVNNSPNYSYKITEHFAISGEDAFKVVLSFKSFGQGRNDTAIIDGEITLNTEDSVNAYFSKGTSKSDIRNVTIQKPYLPEKNYNTNLGIENGYSYTINIKNYKFAIDGITAVINGSLDINNGNRIKQNSFLYITGNADFGNNQKTDLENNKIYVGGNAYFKNTKASIKKSVFYINGDLEFHNQIGEIADSKICVRGSIIDRKNNLPIPIEEWKDGQYNCMLFGGGSPGGSDILDEIAKQVDNMTLIYN
ncbi:type II secretion system protein J [Ureibacillus sp. GCM10028918]|uniref:PulJ/GspJ family protein n=1 Tax=Ureibacillus sp. GCM10028918 TaxID=3273429 RepID=UPI00360D6527